MVTHFVPLDNAPEALVDNSQSWPLESFGKKKRSCVVFTVIYTVYFLEQLMVRSDLELLELMKA